MAGGIERLVVNGVAEILKKLIPVVTEQIDLAWGARGELQKLKNTLEMIKAVLTDAERRQMTDEAVKLWLKRLKDFAYDVDDILDAYLYKCMQKHEWMKHKRYQVLYYASPSTNPVVSCFKLGNKIKKINIKFDQIALEKTQLGLQPYVGPIGGTNDIIDENINWKTYAFLGDSENIVGRETDKNNILEMLLTTDQVEKVIVIPIVGMGGTGKTTLAQLVYNDKSLENSFELKIWVCVSNDFNIERLLKDVTESITKTKCDDLSNLDVLVHKVHKQLGGKKYLLVLDDMWNRNGGKWDELKKLLSVGALGSKIIITTRSEDVAKIVVGNLPIYNLKVLKVDECRSIFKKLAFGTGGPVETPILSDIGEQMIKKCGGLPLAAKTLGSLMYSKKEEHEWQSMRDNEIRNIPEDENRVIPILKLSYYHLPSHLKQCFSYCAIFPKDYIIKRETLIQLWIAEGFIQPYEGNDKLTMEDIGNNYFLSLLRNSLLQDIEIDELGDVKSCKMHDLVHDLAQTVAGTHECLIVDASKIGDISEVRRLHLLNVDDMSLARVSDALKKAKKLRTLIVNSITSGIMNLSKVLFHNNKLLRVLDLNRTFFVELPYEISNLKHLRYLDLPLSIPSSLSSNISRVLPNSISTLYNLQTLKCSMGLPKDINKLIKLRLSISSFHDDPGLELMPRHLGQLTCLRTLQKFIIRDGKSDGYGIEELGSLNSIGGDLAIYALQNVIGGSDVAKSANLEGKPNLRSLSLQWEHSFGKGSDHEMVLEGLQPHPHLKSLQIHGFGGAKLPTWMMGVSSCLPNLVVLRLFGCKGVEQLPSLGELPLLRILSLHEMEGVRCLGKEFHGTGAAATATMKSKTTFPSLKEFTIYGMINLEEWVVEEQQQFPTTYFPHLETLVIRESLKLRVAPTFFPSLKELFIWAIDGRVSWMITREGIVHLVPTSLTVSSMVTRNLTSLTKVDICRVKELQFLPQALLLNNTSTTTLQYLRIEHCPKFEGFVIIPKEEEEDIQQVLLSGSPPHHLSSSSSSKYNSSLEYLHLYECPALTFLPDLRYCTSLRELTIQGCTALTKSLPDEDDLEKWVELQQQQQLPSTTTISSFPQLKKLRINKCPRLKVAPAFFPSLKDLYVCSVKDMIGISMVTRNLTFLIQIYISELEELQFLPQGLLLNCNTLQYLTISKCPKFEGFVIIPKEEEEEEEEEDIQLSEDSPSPVPGSNNSSLKSLKLFNCPVLKILPDLCYFTSLQELGIKDCEELMKSLPDDDEIKKCLPSLKELMLKDYWTQFNNPQNLASTYLSSILMGVIPDDVDDMDEDYYIQIAAGIEVLRLAKNLVGTSNNDMIEFLRA